MKRTLQQRFSGMVPRGKRAEKLADEIYEGGPYAGRTELDQDILACVHIAMEEDYNPDFYRVTGEYARMDRAWDDYNDALNK